MNKYMFRWPIRVYYEDTDAGGVVYHASYVAFYERARTEMLRHHHFSQQVLLAERVAAQDDAGILCACAARRYA